MNSEQVLDFQHIRQKLADVCSSAIAKEYALNLQPMHNRQKIEDALDETVEAMRSLEQEVEQPISGTKDIRTTCTKSRKRWRRLIRSIRKSNNRLAAPAIFAMLVPKVVKKLF